MKLNQKQTELIKASFHKMRDKNDLLELINFVKKLIDSAQFTPFYLGQLTHQAYFATESRYSSFIIRKKNGTSRTILAPNPLLKEIQKCLNIIFESVFHPHNAVHGFTLNKSVATNASVHTGQNYVFNIDLKDFFFSVDQARVWACLQNPPFNLKNEKLEIANLISALCCVELLVDRLNDEIGDWEEIKKKVLPQGAPTSPILTNIVAQRLDYQLSKLAKRLNLKYTRYADDITFSSMHNVYKQDSEFIGELKHIINEENFYINENKTRLQENNHNRQEVTGLVVNEKVNVKRRYIKDIRKWLYLLERYGYERANEIFTINYFKINTKKLNKKWKPNILNVLGGKLNYLKMVVRFNDDRYKKLYSRYQKQYDKLHTLQDYNKQEEDNKLKIDLSNHRPKDVTAFLSLFRSGELKWLTHELDKAGFQFDLKEMVDNSYSEFILKSKILVIPASLYSRIRSFIGKETNDKGVKKLQNWWFLDKNYQFNWYSAKVIEWCQKNPYQHPILNDEFEKEINVFKNSIQIRGDLKELITKIATKKLGIEYPKYDLKYIDVDRAEFFTDVEKLYKGLGHIFQTIKHRPQSKKIKIEFKRIRTITEDYRRLRIIHIESMSEKNLDEIDTSLGDMGSILDNFYQICDWSLISNQPESADFNKINILYDVNKKQHKELIAENIEGFTHELIFYS